jgi:amino-acid N-acetyltransferase
VTDDAALAATREAAGAVRVEVEALLSMGLANTPMAGARIRVASGNFVVARPLGVRDGVDYCHTGEVRRVDGAAIRGLLDQGAVVLVSPIGYSPTGEAFNLSAEALAPELAVELKAAKLLLLGDHASLRDAEGRIVRQYSLAEARARLAELRGARGDEPDEAVHHLQSSIHACLNGVQRVHLLDRHEDGVLLLELFTRDGVGTMVSADPYEALRRATIEDVGGILELIRPLEEAGVLVRRAREKLEQEIDRFAVLERDGAVIASAALYPMEDPGMVELACLAVAPPYRRAGLGDRLLRHAEQEARASGATRLVVLTTHTAHWFRERGFVSADPDALPLERKAAYNFQRNSKVLVKAL